jgi:hypothetical protein
MTHQSRTGNILRTFIQTEIFIFLCNNTTGIWQVINRHHRTNSEPNVHPEWHPIPYLVHYFWSKPYGPCSKKVHYTGNMMLFGTCPMSHQVQKCLVNICKVLYCMSSCISQYLCNNANAQQWHLITSTISKALKPIKMWSYLIFRDRSFSLPRDLTRNNSKPQ